MHGFQLTPEQRALKARVRAFARETVAPHVAEMDRTNADPWPVIKAMAQEGLMGITVPPEYGGGGRPLIDAVLAIEELGKVCGTVARICVDASTAVPKAIAAYGTRQQRARFLPGIPAGDKPAIAVLSAIAGASGRSKGGVVDRHGAVPGNSVNDGYAPRTAW
jgi:hypothetical protein